VTQLLDIFGFLSVVLRGMTLSFEAPTTGGVIFVVAVAGGIVGKDVVGRAFRWLICASTSLATTQVLLASANSAILIGTTDLPPAEIAGAEFWKAS
jgi:putative copper resistance protein D